MQAAEAMMKAAVPEQLLERLFPFQREGVRFMIATGGRALLAVSHCTL
jgi:hypothetical protein